MTNIFEIFIIGLILSLDSFSAALAMGSRPHKLSDTLKFAISSGGAEALVSFLGAFAGSRVISQFDSIDHWISFILLLFVSIHMLVEGVNDLRKRSDEQQPRKFHSFIKVIAVSFATSLDAFVVGVSLGASGKPLIPYISSIGLWAFFSTIIGMGIAKYASRKLGPIFNLVGSIVLLILGFKFLYEGL